MSKKALILDIKANSLDDGPGIRTTVFFKGCLLNCIWCHNPESKSIKPELSYEASECIKCNLCLEACPQQALNHKNSSFIDRSKCNQTFLCVKSCPAEALKRVGIPMSIEHICSQVIKYKPFYDTSGGGVTLSGGEPTIDMKFISNLLKCLKKKKIHTLLQTCGLFDYKDFESLVLPYVDIIYFDIKLIDPEEHKKYCGKTNDRILNNFKKLSKNCKNQHLQLLPRIPLIPNITDNVSNLTNIAELLNNNHIKKTELLEYNPIWNEKYKKIGVRKPVTAKALTKWMEKDKINDCKAIFTKAGIECVT